MASSGQQRRSPDPQLSSWSIRVRALVRLGIVLLLGIGIGICIHCYFFL